jgi:thiol-disulfide isomerase/thioredoxin
MTASKLLAATAIAAIVGGIPATREGGDRATQPSTGLRIPFVHGWFADRGAGSSELTSLDRANAWINSPRLKASDLRGKVVLVDFRTYTCINWRRTLPYVRAWSEKYRDQGLVVVGVHAPEFSFEGNVDNVRQAVGEMHIDYPIAVESDHVIWNGFDNEYWPALYFVDAQGRVRYHQFGEGSYQQSEMIIQELLRENGAANIDPATVVIDGSGFEAAADWINLRSPENYVGYGRAENFANAGGAVFDRPHVYTHPDHLRLNEWELSGDWTVRQESAGLNESNGAVAYRFHARDLHVVMGPAPGTAARFRVSIDGRPPGPAHGVDVDEQGEGKVTAQRLYQLIRQTSPIADREFRIEFLDPGVEVFAFTFG